MRPSIALVLPMSMLLGNAGVEAGAQARDVAFREHVASLFAADCQRTQAPNSAQLQVLRRICTCSVARIRASDVAFGDAQDLVTRKVHQAQADCLTEVYGQGTGSRNRRR